MNDAVAVNGGTPARVRRALAGALASLREILHDAALPDRFHAGTDGDMRGRAVRVLALFLAAGTVLLFFSALANLREITLANRPAPDAADIAFRMNEMTLFAQLLFAPVWLAYVAAAAAMRKGTLSLLGDALSYEGAFAVSVRAALPMIAVGALGGTFSHAFPSVRTWATVVLFGLAWISEAALCVPSLRRACGGHAGRAVIAWAAPVLLGVLLLNAYLVYFNFMI